MSRAQRRGRTDERPGTGTASVTLRWMCPYCGHGERDLQVTEETKDEAVGALRTHIESTPGGGHGPPDALPDDDSLALGHHVIAFDAG